MSLKKKNLNEYKNYKKYIVKKSNGIFEWPINIENYLHEYQKLNDGKYDETIYLNSIRLSLDI